MRQKKTILMIGAFDTKGVEYAFLRDRILACGLEVLAANTGTRGSTDLFTVDVETEEIAKQEGITVGQLAAMDRGEAMKVMASGSAKAVLELHRQGRFDGIIGMGGTGGTSVVTAAMRALPVGVPKVCVSTAAGGDTSAYVGTRDVTLMPSIVDIAGINRISRVIISRAAGAVCGMVNADPPRSESDRPIITASMFGNTTECVSACAAALSRAGYEVLIFHATGTGGRTMEALVSDGLVAAVLDITTTEWADTVAGGVFDAGPERLDAPGRMGVPHLIVPGCVDMVNFGAPATVPQKYRDASRLFYEWNPSVTLMRTNADENRRMGEVFARKANSARGPVAFLVPLRGVSILDGEGQLFQDWATDQVMFDAIRKDLKPGIPFVTMDSNINAPEFAERAVAMMLDLVRKRQKGGAR